MTRFVRGWILGLLTAAALAVVPLEARAGGFTMATFGARRGGMGANMGSPDDVTAVFHNPAGLADQPGVQLYFFVSPGFLDPVFRLQALDPVRYPAVNPTGCGQTGRPACPWPIDSEGYYARRIKLERTFGIQPFLAASTDLAFIHPRARDVVVSLAVFAPNVYAGFLPENAPTAYHIIGGLMVVGSATLGVGWRINRYLSVGAHLSYNLMYLTMAQKLSTVDALTPQGEDPDAIAQFAQELLGDIRMDYQGMDHGVGWAFSVLLTPVRWLNIGISYIGATPARFEGDVRFRALGEDAQAPGFLDEAVHSVGYKLPKRLVVEMPIPPTLAVGLHFKVNRWFEIGVEGRFWFYQIYKKQTLRPIYDPDEEGEEPLTEESLSRDKKYHLSYQITGGVLFRPVRRLPGLEFMLGTGYDQSPMPDETFTLDNPSLSHAKVAVGVRWRINAHWRLGLSYYLNVFIPRDITTSETNPPTNVQGRGLSHAPGFEMTYRF